MQTIDGYSNKPRIKEAKVRNDPFREGNVNDESSIFRMISQKEYAVSPRNEFEYMKIMKSENQPASHRIRCFVDEIKDRMEIVQPR